MCATILGAAVAAHLDLGRATPTRVVFEGNDSTTIIVPSGRQALLVAVIDRSVDVATTLEEAGRSVRLLEGNQPLQSR